jgi:hypothetical protein
MNPKTAVVLLVIPLLLASLISGVHMVRADSTGGMLFAGGITVYSPVNATYDSNFLTLNLTCGCGAGLQFSLNYAIDGAYEGAIPLMYSGTPGFQLIVTENGTVQLPELSAGSHCLTIYEQATLNDYHGANPPGAPFQPISLGSADYVASWVDPVYFSINSSAVAQTSTQQPALSSPPTIMNLSIENKTYTMPDLPLIFTVNGSTSKVAYSLDGKNNVTVAGNTTLTRLSVGAHNLTIYAWNDNGSVSASQTVDFAVASMASSASGSSAPFQMAVVAGLIASVAVFVGCCLACFKKRKR